MASELTAEALRLLVAYDPATGELRQRNATGRHVGVFDTIDQASDAARAAREMLTTGSAS